MSIVVYYEQPWEGENMFSHANERERKRKAYLSKD